MTNQPIDLHVKLNAVVSDDLRYLEQMYQDTRKSVVQTAISIVADMYRHNWGIPKPEQKEGE